MIELYVAQEAMPFTQIFQTIATPPPPPPPHPEVVVILERHDPANDPENMVFGLVRSRTPQLTGRTAAFVGSALHVPVFDDVHARVDVPQFI